MTTTAGRPAQLAPVRIGTGTRVHLGYLSSITGPAGEPRYCSWCPASKKRDSTVEAGEAVAEAIDCGSCRRQADTEALERAAAAAAEMAHAAEPMKEHAETGEPARYDLDLIVAELGRLDVPAFLEQTGGGTATLYAGESTYDFGERCHRMSAVAGPGHFDGPGWTRGKAWREEFSLGRNDEDLNESVCPPQDATEAQVALMIANVVQGTAPLDDGRVLAYERQPVEKVNPLAEAVTGDPTVTIMLKALTQLWIDEGRPRHPFTPFTRHRDQLESRCRWCGLTRDDAPEHT